MNVAALLKQELARRTHANPAYSMRSMAKSLEMSPSQLCEILGGRKNMSSRTQSRIAKKLGWGARATSRKRPDDIRRMSWWHLALLELSSHEKLTPDPNRIGRRLGISSATAKIAIDDLITRGLLEVKGGNLHPFPGRLFFGDGTPSETIRTFHKEAMQLAIRQIDLTNYEDREYSFSTLALTSEAAQELRRRLRDVVEEFSEAANASSGPKEIFGFSAQLYKISNQENQTGET